MRKLVYLLAVILLYSCGSSEQKEKKIVVQMGDIAQQSEMASLMLLMYERGEQNKQLILEGKQPEKFPEQFLKIHTAKLTDPTDRTDSFKTFSNNYLTNLKGVYEGSEGTLKERHNLFVKSCIACHETTCVGPIPRIKKLYIK